MKLKNYLFLYYYKNVMRKITFFLMLFLVCAGRMQAQFTVSETPLSEISDGQTVLIKEPTGTGVSGWSGGQYLNAASSGTVVNAGYSAIYKFIKDGEKTEGENTYDVYVLQNLWNGQYLKANNSYTDAKDQAFHFTARKAEVKTKIDNNDWEDYSNAVDVGPADDVIASSWVFCSSTGKNYLGFVGNPSTMGYTDTNYWFLYGVTVNEADYVNIKFNYTLSDGATVSIHPEAVLAPHTFEIPQLDFCSNYQTEGSLSESGTVTVTCDVNYPVQFLTVANKELMASDHWYTLYMRGETNNQVYTNGETAKVGAAVENPGADRLFGFERVGKTYPVQVRVYCLQEGTDRPLSVANFNNDTKASWTDGNKIFRLTPNGNGFNIQQLNGNKALDHNRGNGLLGIWTAGLGSQTNAVAAKVDLTADIDESKMYQIVYERGSAILGNYDAVAGEDGQVSQSAESRRVVTALSEDGYPYVSSLWKFHKQGDGKVKITAVNSGFYLGSVDQQHLVTTQLAQWGRSYTLDGAYGTGIFALYDETVSGDNYLNSYYNPAGGNEGHDICYWNSSIRDGGNRILINEVESIPVAISSVGYATLHLPFAVTLPAVGNVKAYVAADNGTYVTLTEIEGGVIPARTPVILTGDAGTHDFAVAYDNTDAPLSTALSGTLTKQTVGTAGEVYILAANAAGEAGMRQVTDENDRTLPANKAYLGSADGTAAVKAFSFGPATGIGNVPTAAGADEVFYDLRGRRVFYPAHGVFVKGNGQKVYIK